MESPGLRKEEVQVTVEEFLLQSVRQKLLTKFASPAVVEVGSLSSIFQLSISIFSPNPWSNFVLNSKFASAMLAVCGHTCGIVLVVMKRDTKPQSIFSNLQHFGGYTACMPSPRLRQVDMPLC